MHSFSLLCFISYFCQNIPRENLVILLAFSATRLYSSLKSIKINYTLSIYVKYKESGLKDCLAFYECWLIVNVKIKDINILKPIQFFLFYKYNVSTVVLANMTHILTGKQTDVKRFKNSLWSIILCMGLREYWQWNISSSGDAYSSFCAYSILVQLPTSNIMDLG